MKNNDGEYMRNHEQLGKYRILEELGQGGFATVYRAVDTTLDREVALKVLDPLLMRDATWVARFRQEAKAVANLRHRHIVGIFEINEVEGRLYIAMELARGGSLAQAITARGRLPWSETLALLQPVCEALDYAHQQGIVHRDLKPANILLDPEGGALLTDFGFARLLVDNSMSMSLSGGILGTPAYIAPEIWEYDRAEVPADIYALGCITYEMLVGEVLFGGKTPMQSMRAHDQGPHFPAAWPEDVPEAITPVLEKALAREPETRYPAAGSFWYALHDLEAQVEAEREAAERIAVAAQWRAEAEAAMEEEEWRAAKMAVGRWLAVTPEDAEASQTQQRIEEALVAQTDPLLPAYQALREALSAQQWEEALVQGQQIVAANPDYRDVQALLEQARAGQGAQERAEAETALAAGELSQALKSEIGQRLAVTRQDPLEGYYQRLQTLVQRGHWTEAHEQAGQILAHDPDYRDVPELAKLAAEKRRGVRGRAQGAGGEGQGASSKTQASSIQHLASSNELVLELAPGVEMIFVRIPAGAFVMGSDPQVDKLAYRDEQPQRTIHLDDYWIGKYPVTNAQYMAFVQATQHRSPRHWRNGEIPSGKAQHPVVWVSWKDADVFCAWVTRQVGRSVRLPTEAQWEKAARGTDGRLYPWGNAAPSALLCNFDGHEQDTTPVGHYSPYGDSPYGCVDMSGNVWEWCADWYVGDYYNNAPAHNPTGPASGSARVLRGGSWFDSEWGVRGANRLRSGPIFTDDFGGFRCAAGAAPGE
jgi:formylglycine-generating enzyme required for sulfatase activity